jgi:hypothetical protein
MYCSGVTSGECIDTTVAISLSFRFSSVRSSFTSIIVAVSPAHRPRLLSRVGNVAKGYAEGPAAEEAERRREELERGGGEVDAALRAAVFGGTADNAETHFLGWRDEVDPDELFASGKAWGLVVRRVPAEQP